MSGDSRSVSTDALETLGTIIDEHAGRDAIHVAVEPVMAAEELRPGQDVAVDGNVAFSIGDEYHRLVGIVDPFLKDNVQPGQHFWMLLYPRTITSLRHVWSHPSIPDKYVAVQSKNTPTKEEAEAWLRDFCAHSDCPCYDDLMPAIINGSNTLSVKSEHGEWEWSISIDGEYIHVNGSDAHASIPDEFWDYAEIVTGKKFGKWDRPKYFSCSC